MDNVVRLNTGYCGADGNWLAGYAAGLADAKRDGADIDELLANSGLTKEEFEQRGADAYDIEELFDDQ